MPRKAVSHHETRSANSSGACEGADCSQTDLYIRGRGEEAGREARAVDSVDRRGGAGDDLLLLEPRHDFGVLHPGEAMVSSSTPKPCTPSTQRTARSASARPWLAFATAWAKRAIGVRTPVLECTQVTATTRVRGRISRASACVI